MECASSKISSAVIMNPPKTMSFIALQAIKVVITSVE
jgi:hypothetical protein